MEVGVKAYAARGGNARCLGVGSTGKAAALVGIVIGCLEFARQGRVGGICDCAQPELLAADAPVKVAGSTAGTGFALACLAECRAGYPL